jgi:biopolymer transport protein ExbD/biopolymer transport protein TolR
MASRRNLIHKTVKPRPSEGVKAEINVTPLVDVVLVLLIIFMVITPMLSRGVDVELPITDHHEKKQDTGDQLVVSVSAAGVVYFDTARVDTDHLKSKVEEELRKNPGKEIFFKGDKRIKYGVARETLETIHGAGATVVQLGTDEVKK